MKPESIPRVLSLDVFRGITIVLMIIVNSPGNPMPYGWLEHAAWDGCTLADVVFPFFIIIVGISVVLALSNLKAKGVPQTEIVKKIIWRSVYIFLMGLLLNAFPHHLLDWSHLRIMGVLQRIAICYFVSAGLFLTTSMRTQAMIAVVLLIGYAFSSLLLAGDAAGYIDRLILSPNHLYTKTFDPEGLLSTMPAIVSVLFGNLIGFQLISNQAKLQQVQQLLGAGTLLMLLGWCFATVVPINKSLWSSSYVLWTTGVFLLSFVLVYVLIEVKAWRRWSKFFNVFGRHALLVYMLHVLFLKIQAMMHVHNAAGALVSLRLYLTEVLFGYLTPQNASLCYSVSYTLLWFLVLFGIERWRKR
ncbi:MAG: DUF5009 domain-containing protein [Gammaproteobacteria bacterium]|nr:DUF5009 domain-containing protein [Gammaproteobacteria bacterium]